MENIQSRITLVKNALSNRRNELRHLSKVDINPGGQGLTDRFENDTNLLSQNKYLVQTILFDDLVDFLPKDSNGNTFKRAILKIDIEGFEPIAFQSANFLFKSLKIDLVFMEWGNKGQLAAQSDRDLVQKMISFLYDKHKMAPFDARNGGPLEIKKFEQWPWDIIWRSNEILSLEHIAD